MRGSMQQQNYYTKTISCLRVMQGGYHMNIRWNQNFMFYEERSRYKF